MIKLKGAFSGILVDCDGTAAVNAEDKHRVAVQDTLKTIFNQVGVTFPEDRYERIWHEQLGKGIANFYDTFMDGFINDQLSRLRLVSENSQYFEGEYEEHFCDYARSGEAGIMLRKGLDVVVASANEVGVPIAIISNAKQRVLESTIHAIGLTDHVQLIAGMDTIKNAGYTVKPKPGSFQYGCDMLSIDPAEAIGFEDTQSGVESLHAAGIGTIVYCHNNNAVPIPAFVTEVAHIVVHPGQSLDDRINWFLSNRTAQRTQVQGRKFETVVPANVPVLVPSGAFGG